MTSSLLARATRRGDWNVIKAQYPDPHEKLSSQHNAAKLSAAVTLFDCRSIRQQHLPAVTGIHHLSFLHFRSLFFSLVGILCFNFHNRPYLHTLRFGHEQSKNGIVHSVWPSYNGHDYSDCFVPRGYCKAARVGDWWPVSLRQIWGIHWFWACAEPSTKNSFSHFFLILLISEFPHE